MVSMEMYELGAKSSVIRVIFEFGKKRAAEIGKENVYDYSLGNPSVPAPEKVNETIRKLTEELSPCELHGYTSAVGDNATRTAIADNAARSTGVCVLSATSITYSLIPVGRESTGNVGTL